MSPFDLPDAWIVITHLGSAAVALPVLLLQYLLLRPGDRRAADLWMGGFIVALSAAMVTKLMFYGFGVGIASLDFTGISTHALVGASVLPMVCRLRVPERFHRWRHAGTAFGVLLAVAVAVSRVELTAHSVSESVSGCVMGLAVSLTAVRALRRPLVQPRIAAALPLLLLLAFSSSAVQAVPAHSLELKIANWLSGRAEPFPRSHLHRPPG